MKNTLIFLVLASLCFSCNNSDDRPLSERIIGEWAVNTFAITCLDASNNVPLTQSNDQGCINIWGQEQCITTVFQEDGIGTMRYSFDDGNYYEEVFEYTIDNATNVINADNVWGGNSFFTLKNNQLTLEMDEDGCLCVLEFKH